MKFNLTFKEYLKSKEELLEAVNITPKQTVEYTVHKYCKLIVGESKYNKEQINLKPNQKIKIDWLYEDIDNPLPLSIMFEGVCTVVDTEKHSTYWDSIKLRRWLLRNTYRKNN